MSHGAELLGLGTRWMGGDGEEQGSAMSGPGVWPDRVFSEVSTPQGETRDELVGQRPGLLMRVVSGLKPSLHYVSKDSLWKRLSKYLRNSVKR